MAIDERNNVPERVDVVAGVPADRVRWGPILAGTFAAMTALAVLSALGAAIGFSRYDPGDNASRFAVGAGIWGIISMILSFGFGGWLAARSAAIHGHNGGLLNGFMVAAFGIPCLFLFLGSATALMTHAAIASNRDQPTRDRYDGVARQASDVMSPTDRTASGSTANDANNRSTEDARDTGKRAAWSTLIGLVLAIAAASFAGIAGSRDDNLAYYRGRSGRGTNEPTGE